MTESARLRGKGLSAFIRPTDAELQAAAFIEAQQARIEALEADRPQFTGVAKQKLDDLIARGWQISGYAITKDGLHGLVTTGGFVGWWSVADANVQAAEARCKRLGEALKAVKNAARKNRPDPDAIYEIASGALREDRLALQENTNGG